MRAMGLISVVLAICAASVAAEAPSKSPRPQPRPGLAAAAAPSESVTIPRPRLRPVGLAMAAPQQQVAPADVTAVSSPVPRPRARPQGLAKPDASAQDVAVDPAPAAKGKKQKKSKKGSVCGDPDIKGENLPRISSKTKGCGVSEPVRVSSIDGIPFSQPATFDCDTALAMKKWIQKGMRPAFGNREVVKIHIYGSYMCRTRNNVRGAKVSEHGRGKAVDIAGFILSDGKEWTIARDYNKTIRKAHKAACGIFGTTLGPGSDGYHEDHLHFDTASYRSGSYCR